jgi:hypothetical protein
MCSFPGCDREPIAQELCAKHYMRQRRTGDPAKTGKAGRPANPLLAHLTKTFSRRTASRIRTGTLWFREAGASEKTIQQALQECTIEPHGGLNATKFLRLAATYVLRCADELGGPLARDD